MCQQEIKIKRQTQEGNDHHWDDSTNDLDDEESYSTNEDSSKSVVVFITFTQNDSSCKSESDKECENDESELQEAFDKLFEESSSLEKLVAQLINENKETSKIEQQK